MGSHYQALSRKWSDLISPLAGFSVSCLWRAKGKSWTREEVTAIIQGRHNGGGGKEMLPDVAEVEPTEFIDKIGMEYQKRNKGVKENFGLKSFPKRWLSLPKTATIVLCWDQDRLSLWEQPSFLFKQWHYENTRLSLCPFSVTLGGTPQRVCWNEFFKPPYISSKLETGIIPSTS